MLIFLFTNSFFTKKINPLKFIMNSIATHLLEVVKEVELTEEEWLQDIIFLTNTGKNVMIESKNLFYYPMY
jgi:hypothetical protein